MLASSFSSEVVNRGSAYFRDGSVDLDFATPSAAAAEVYGSEVYNVDLVLDGTKIWAACNCPYIDTYGALCKHIWATLRAAENRGFAVEAAKRGKLAISLDLDNDEPPEPSPSPKPVVAKPKAVRPDAWERELESLGRAVQPYSAVSKPAERRLAWILNGDPSGTRMGLSLESAVIERKANGEWSQPKIRYVSPHDLASFADPVDRRLGAIVIGKPSHVTTWSSRYCTLESTLIDVARPMFAETNRLYFRASPEATEAQHLEPDLGPPWQLTAAVVPDSEGKRWQLAVVLSRGDEKLSLDATDLVQPGIVVWQGRFAAFDDRGAFSWVLALRRKAPISVPKERAGDLLAFLMRQSTLPALSLPPELQIDEVAVAPKPKLAVRPPKSAHHAGVLDAELMFAYDAETVSAEPFARGVFQVDSRRLLLRDRVAEEAAASRLAELGVKKSTRHDVERELKVGQLAKIARTLTEAGWQVEADGKLYKTPAKFNLSVSSGTDWFDLSATADFDGMLVSLPRLLEAARRGDTSVLLDDGSLGMLPEEWLDKNGLLAKLGTVDGDRVRFGKAQLGVLDALLASRPEIEFDRLFERARKQLRKFSGVTPSDPPRGFKGELRGYQREGLGWLKFLRQFGVGGCLADDMGLGKTVMVLALIAGMKRTAPVLVVVPRSLVFNWKQEAARFAPKLRVLDHTGSQRDRTGAAFADYDIVLTTYGILRLDAEMIASHRFDTCILDEAQAVKNAATDSAKAVRLVQSDHRLAMSGTPVENHLGELWSLFDFLNPGMLGRAAAFSDGTLRNPTPETRDLLAKALRPYILRRTKAEVAKDLPAKTEQTIFCDLDPQQRRLYDELRDHYRASLLKEVDEFGMKRSKIQVLAALTRLRQAACHPGLIDKNRKNAAGAKLDTLLPQLKELAEEGNKALVFSQFTSFLDIVQRRLDEEGIVYERLDGRTQDRQARVARFQTDPECKLFLISLKAGGVGLNLTSAGYVFLLDPWWNPAAEAQAIDRTHRIGQTVPVFAYRLIAKDTVEEKVLALQATKRALADAILGGDSGPITDLKREDLELLLS